VPGFLYVLILYIVGRFIIPDARATLFDIWGYQLSWVEVLLFTAAIVAMTEQIKVAKRYPGRADRHWADGRTRRHDGGAVDRRPQRRNGMLPTRHDRRTEL